MHRFVTGCCHAARMSIPEELERWELCLAPIAVAKAKIDARTEERLGREQADHHSKLAARAEQEKRTSKKRGGAGNSDMAMSETSGI
jgi:hypothetical protein